MENDQTNLMAREAELYLSIPLAIQFTDHSSSRRVLHLTRDSMKFPAIERLRVKRHRRVITRFCARDVDFSS